MPAGLMFLAFAFNMVDCGGLLGGRLGMSAPPPPPIYARRSIKIMSFYSLFFLNLF